MADHVSDSSEDDIVLQSSHVRQRQIAESILEIFPEVRLQNDAFAYLHAKGILPGVAELVVDEAEEKDHLRIVEAYLKEGTESSSSRRSLRKRNFSSTHPYVADQAQWLGLTTVDALNELYSETNDTESILKLLSSMYMKKKTKYPREEKFKPKSFYAFLGRNMPPQENQDEAFQTSQVSKDSQPVQEKTDSAASDTGISYLELESDEFLPKPSRRKGSRSIVDDDLEAESSDEDMLLIEPLQRDSTFYRVREHIATNSAVLARQRKAPVTKSARKGLAKKKVGIRARRKKQNTRALAHFIDDSSYYAEGAESLISLNHVPQNEQGPQYHAISLEDAFQLSESDFFSETEDLDSYSHYVEMKFEGSGLRGGYYGPHHANDSVLNTSKTKNRSNSFTPLQSSVMLNNLRAKSTPTMASRRLPDQNSVLRERKASHQNRMKRTKKALTVSSHNAQKFLRTTRVNQTKTRVLKKPSLFRSATSAHTTAPILNIFQRVPNSSTTIFEATKYTAESEHQPKGRSYMNTFSAPVASLRDFNRRPFGNFDVRKISELDTEHHILSSKDSISIMLYGQHFLFTIFDPAGSNRSFVSLVNSIIKGVKALDFSTNAQTTVLSEANDALKNLIEWELVMQKPEYELIRLLSTAASELLNLLIGVKVWAQLFSKVLLLEYVMVKILRRVDPSGTKQFDCMLQGQSSDFLRACFVDTDFIEDATNIESPSKINESISAITIIFENDSKMWWNCISDALTSCRNVTDLAHNILQDLTWLALSYPTVTNWKAFLAFHNIFCKELLDLELNLYYLKVIREVGEKLSWPFDERLVLIVYSSIAERRFADFEDEGHSDLVLGVIRTRSDIPELTFFEGFMHFLYIYVSGLPLGSNKKRLITKLLTTGRYHYSTGSSHRAMFLNRLNFTLLLCQISDIDLEPQFVNLICQVDNSNDYRMYHLVIKGITTLTNAAIKRRDCFPYLSVPHMIELISQKYDTMPEIFRLWKSIRALLRTALLQPISSSMISFIIALSKLSTCALPDQITLEITDFLIKSLDVFPDQWLQLDFYENVSSNNLQVLNCQMARYPLTSQKLENQIDSLVEKSIKLWVLSAVLLNNRSWDILLLQKFPYIGLKDLRERFSLFFYETLLNSNALTGSCDLIIASVMKHLAMFAIPKYLIGLINQLMRRKHPFFYLKAQCGLDLVTGLQLLNFRSTITGEILQNIACASPSTLKMRLRYVEEFVEQLNADFQLFFLSQRYANFCKKMTLLILNVILPSLYSNQTLKNLSMRLGIAQPKRVDNWTELTLIQRLKLVNDELTSAISIGSDYASVLDSYVIGTNMEVIFYLQSIYCQELPKYGPETWSIFCHLMYYIWSRMQKSRVDYAGPSFLKSMRVVADALVLCDKEDADKQLQNELQKVREILRRVLGHARRTFDGFREQDELSDLISGPQQHSTLSGETNLSTSRMSQIRLSDIQSLEMTKSSYASDSIQIDLKATTFDEGPLQAVGTHSAD